MSDWEKNRQSAPVWDAIVVGGGGAGLFCARTAALLKKSVLVLDHADSLGKKILISGGGRCNFTNVGAKADLYFSSNTEFAKSAMARFRPADFLALVEKYGIEYYEKKLGQLFCKTSAKEILRLLQSECAEAGVNVDLNVKINSVISLVKSSESAAKFEVKAENKNYLAKNLVIATGGLSIPKIGASDFGYRIAKQFGHRITNLDPALVGLTYDRNLKSKLSDLSGISIDSQVTIGKFSFRENVLLTHEGISGPAILQASLYWKEGEQISIQFLPDEDLAEWLLSEKKFGNKKEIKNVLSEKFTQRMVDRWMEIHQLVGGVLNQLSDQAIRNIARSFQVWQVQPAGTFGYGRAEVTRGGVSTDQVQSKSMESKLVPGLFFVGEVLDVTGRLGGYNFQWAWASGYAAGSWIGSAEK